MTRLGRYELGPLLGEGGAGRVHRATLRGPGGFRREVALKVLKSGAEQLRREARIGGLLRHRNLVDVYEVGEDDGQWFCALELCDGTLAPHVPLPPRAVVEVGLQVCEALRYAHEELGLIHRDLKPTNLLLKGGLVKVADLGIARAEGFGDDGRVRGTPAYMPPEQRAGGQLDARADIYALGVTLVELATGMRPVASGTMDLSSFETGGSDTLDVDSLGDDWTLAGTPGAPPEIPVPPWLADAILPCLAPDPVDRWPSMDALAEALRGLDATGPGLAEVLGADAADPDARIGTNLDDDPDAFVGRSGELAALEQALDRPGQLTLKGPAGVGKSRLARTAARGYRAKTGCEAWFCDLTEARDLDGLLFAVARTLDVPMARGTHERQLVQLGHALASRGDAVLILDNFEQIRDLAPVLARWRRSARRLRMLVTSRETLRIPGETVVELGPLDLESAERLVIDRARTRGVDLRVDPDLPELARRLEGLPLALELAAGRLGVLSVRDVLDRLSLSLLRAGTDDRHGTLQGALEWSWELLGREERSVLAQLSVFAGGFGADAAEEIALSEAPVLDLLDALADRSLIRASGERFHMLVSVQAFAATKLDDPGPIRERHAAWFARMGTVSAVESYNHHGGWTRRRLVMRDQANLVAACRRAAERGATRQAVDTLCAAWAAMEVLGPYELGIQLADGVGALADLTWAERSRTEAVAGQARAYAGRTLEALTHYRQSLEAAEQAEDPRLVSQAEGLLAAMQHELGHMADGEERYRRALETARANGYLAQQASLLGNYGNLCREVGRHEQAEQLFSQALRIHRQIGNRLGEGQTLGNQGALYNQLGQRQKAGALFERALRIHREVGNRRSEALTLGNLGVHHLLRGELDRAEERFTQAMELHQRVGYLRNKALLIGNLAILEFRRGRPLRALDHYERALTLNREVGNRRSESYVLGNMASTLRDLGRLDEAAERFEEAIEVCRELSDRRMEGTWTAALAGVARRQGDATRAQGLLDRAEPLLRAAKDPSLLARLLAERAHLAIDRGALAEARGWLDEAAQIAPADDDQTGLELEGVRDRLA